MFSLEMQLNQLGEKVFFFFLTKMKTAVFIKLLIMVLEFLF